MKTLIHVFRGAAAALAISVALGACMTATAAEPARAVVSNLDHTLLTTMKQAKSLGFAGRYKALAPVIDQAFDLDKIARLALGPQWSKLDANQQKQYQAMFRKDTIATYAERFDGYSGEQFEIVKVESAAAGRKQVDTQLTSKDHDPVPINYILEQDGGRWQIVNVVAKGVSDLALKRGQYSGVIRDQGPDAFIAQFQKQLKKYPTIPETAD